jgi:hypothetical protein
MTVRTRAQLNDDADTYLANNAGGEISPGDVRQRVKDLADSAKFAEDLFGKQMIPIPAAAIKPRATNGPSVGSVEMATNKNMLVTLDFDTSTKEYGHFNFPSPKQIDETATIVFRARWTAASGSGGVAWSLAIRATSDDDAIDGAYGTAVTVTDTLTAANDDDRTAESSAITVGNSFAEGDMLWFEIAREVANGSDTLGVDAKLIALEVYIINNAGTDA